MRYVLLLFPFPDYKLKPREVKKPLWEEHINGLLFFYFLIYFPDKSYYKCEENTYPYVIVLIHDCVWGHNAELCQKTTVWKAVPGNI